MRSYPISWYTAGFLVVIDKSPADLISQHNGGKIKKLEKLAEYRIVDPTKEPQPGSYSYEWITDSVRAGIVLPKEKFAYAGGTAAARPNAASSRRGIRAAFTDEEDRLLTAWVIKYESLGYGSSGNKIYEPLAQKVRERLVVVYHVNAEQNHSTRATRSSRGETAGSRNCRRYREWPSPKRSSTPSRLMSLAQTDL